MGMLMSKVISEVLTELRNEIELVVPNPDMLERLFNRAQLEIALELECVPLELSMTLSGYLTESGTCHTETTSRKVMVAAVGGASALNNDTNGDYDGYLLENTTRKETAYITYSTINTGEWTFYLSREIADQVSTDSFTIIRQRKWVDLPWYVIRPQQKKGVYWDSYPLSPVSVAEVKELYRNSEGQGTPYLYAQEGQKLWIYPQPSSTGKLFLSGVRRPAKCFRVATTSAGSSYGDTAISTAIPERDDDYYRGAELEVKSGDLAGETHVVDEWDVSNDTLYFEEAFSGQVGSGVTIELLSGISEDFQPAIASYIKWKLLRRDRDYKKDADEFQLDYMREKERLRDIYLSRNTAQALAGKEIHVSRKGYILTSRSR